MLKFEIRKHVSSQISRNLKLKIFRTNCLSVRVETNLEGSADNRLKLQSIREPETIVKIRWSNTIRNEDLETRTSKETELDG